MPFSEAFVPIRAIVRELHDMHVPDEKLEKLIEDIGEGRIPIFRVNRQVLVFRQSAVLKVAEAVYEHTPALVSQKTEATGPLCLSEGQKQSKEVKELQRAGIIDVLPDGAVRVKFEKISYISGPSGSDIRMQIAALDDVLEFKATLRACVACYDSFFTNHPELSTRFLSLTQRLSPKERMWLFGIYSRLHFAIPRDLEDRGKGDARYGIYVSANADNLAHLLTIVVSRVGEDNPFWQRVAGLVSEQVKEGGDGFDTHQFMDTLGNEISELDPELKARFKGLFRPSVSGGEE